MSDFFNKLYNSSKVNKNKDINFVSLGVNTWNNNSNSFIKDDYSLISNTENFIQNIKFLDSGSNEKNINNHDYLLKSEPSIEVNKLIKNVIAYLQLEDYVDGEVSKTHLYLEILHYKYPIVFKEIFQKIWLKMFTQSPHNLRNFICISAGLPYEWLGDCADALILGAFSHIDESVHEAAIRAIESWDNPEHVELISNTRPLTDKYLEQYRQSVLNSLRK